MEIIDKYRAPSGNHGPYDVTVRIVVSLCIHFLNPPNKIVVTLISLSLSFRDAENFIGSWKLPRWIVVNNVYNQPEKHRIKLPTVPVRTTGTLLVEMVEKNGWIFSDIPFALLCATEVASSSADAWMFNVMLYPREHARLSSFSWKHRLRSLCKLMGEYLEV